MDMAFGNLKISGLLLVIQAKLWRYVMLAYIKIWAISESTEISFIVPTKDTVQIR